MSDVNSALCGACSHDECYYCLGGECECPCEPKSDDSRWSNEMPAGDVLGVVGD